MELVAAGAIALAILMIALAAWMGRTRANTVARVEALRALAAETADADPIALPSAPTELGDDLPASAPIQHAAPVPSNRFVVNIPDASSGPRYQVSFQRGRN